jgi:LysR family transcriptional regulator, glycine cleavage system transcriptional activator
MPASRPPLNALHVFCAVVRTGGFRQAADHLCVTPGAVSRQIVVLETRLGVALFKRGARVCLTEAGKRLHGRIADKLESVCAALDVRPNIERPATILVDTGVTFAMHWLIPNLRAFKEQHPHIEVKVRTAGHDNVSREPADVIIRRNVADLMGMAAHVFMTERSVLVSGASFDAGPRSGGAGLRWLARVPRIGARSRPDLWPRWGESHGLNGPSCGPTIEFDNTVLAIQAAAQGLGACVLPEVFVQDMLGSSTLRLLHASRIQTGTYAVAEGRRHSPMVEKFLIWLDGMGEAYA